MNNTEPPEDAEPILGKDLDYNEIDTTQISLANIFDSKKESEMRSLYK